MNKTQQSHWDEPKVGGEPTETEPEMFLAMLNDCIFKMDVVTNMSNAKLSCVMKPDVKLINTPPEPILESWSPLFGEMRYKLRILNERIEETKFCIEHAQLPNLGVLK